MNAGASDVSQSDVAKVLELTVPGPARRNPANPARSGRKQR